VGGVVLQAKSGKKVKLLVALNRKARAVLCEGEWKKESFDQFHFLKNERWGKWKERKADKQAAPTNHKTSNKRGGSASGKPKQVGGGSEARQKREILKKGFLAKICSGKNHMWRTLKQRKEEKSAPFTGKKRI